MSFEKLNLNPAILQAIADSGYTEPSPIQAAAIPEVLAGHDLMASAQTGTGKTAAFILPALQYLTEPSQSKSKGPRIEKPPRCRHNGLRRTGLFRRRNTRGTQAQP